MSEMKPLRFPQPVADEMVRAILDGRKTVTRRVVKPQPVNIMTAQERKYRALSGADPYGFCVGTLDTELLKQAPYRPDDILYVKETWDFDPDNGPGYIYRADYNGQYEIKWKQSIHMPRDAARIFLRVTYIGVERLQEIYEDQIKKEGIHKRTIPVLNAYNIVEYVIPGTKLVCPSAHGAFKYLWDSTIKPKDRAIYGWEANPWCWVIEFERMSRKEVNQ